MKDIMNKRTPKQGKQKSSVFLFVLKTKRFKDFYFSMSSHDVTENATNAKVTFRFLYTYFRL